MVTMSNRSRRSPVKVGFYDIQKTIGRGNFAEVKLARHRITKTDVAIKIIDKTSLDQTYLKKIYREIQILKLLNHQHIIKLYQVIQTKTTIYLVCEYARNGELFDYITQNGKLPEERAQKMFWQVLCAVEYCHKNNVVHRDLKAENMLLDGSNNIKLADFGFGNFFQSGQNLSTWCGSPPYAAPEVFEGKLYEGPQLDVWSLGVVLYVLVCGTFPFDGSNLSTLKERVLGGLFRIPFWMSQDCENLLRKMLVLNPKKRLTISQIKKHKWLNSVRPKENVMYKLNERRGNTSEYNEHVFKIMQSLKIDINKTKESLNLSTYDHLYAIYHLLADRLKLHRTSYPLESLATEKRRPSNIAEQVLLSVKKMPTTNSNHCSSNPLLAGFNRTIIADNNVKPTNNNTMEIGDVSFDDVTSELPAINRTLVDSPPLPLIKTTFCRDFDSKDNHQVYQQNTDLNLLHIPNSGVPVVHQTPTSQQYGYNFFNTPGQSAANEFGDGDIGGYNLQHRRHTLMVPDSSQIQQFNLALRNQIENSQQLDNSGESLNLQQQEPILRDSAYDANNLQIPSHKKRVQLYRNTNQLHPNDIVQYPIYNDQINKNFTNVQSPKNPLFNNSQLGFREGRRASDGLLLLGDNLLKEHLQKLARVKGVPEITKDVETTDEHSGVSPTVLMQNQSNQDTHTNAANQNAMYGSNGDSINFQPYNNNLSLTRRRSLQVQHMQLRRSSVTAVPIPTGIQAENTNQGSANNFHDAFTGSHPGVNDSTSNDAEYMRQWSSWKQVQGSHDIPNQQPEGREESANLFSSIAMSVASDDSVPSKAAAAAQIQRDALQKPIRQQSLPISSNPKGGYSFSLAFTNQPQSLAQQLQQRRFERRIKVASHHNQQALPYQSPLPELERLKINEDSLSLNQQGASRIIGNNMLNHTALNDTDSHENSVHGLRCFGSGEQTPVHFGLNMQMTLASSMMENNVGLSENVNFNGNLPAMNFGSNPDTVLSWVENSHKIYDSMEYAMY